MINAELTRLMTRLAVFESREEKDALAIADYYRKDFIGAQVLSGIVSGTIAFVIILVLYVFYNIEDLMQAVFTMDLLIFARNILLIYFAFILVYGIICYLYATYQYDKKRKRLKGYLGDMKELYHSYKRPGASKKR
ncbi:MAG: hypothetical protein LUC95_02400 [Lachnospiraceae bacterium]|nr:hypothetical protein [Lachnospiraceae bacterium]